MCYLAVDEARYFVAFHYTNLKNIRYIAESKSLWYTPATKKNFASNTPFFWSTIHNQSDIQFYQDLFGFQEIKRYVRLSQIK